VPDVLIHLAWHDLHDFASPNHCTATLPAHIRFLEHMVRMGCPRVIAAGTCLEYGMQYGPLSEDHVSDPVVAYAVAKDALRRSLECLRQSVPFQLQWPRLFYMYGEGQPARGLFGQLDAAIARKADVFDMSSGDQLRDYLPVDAVAHRLVELVMHPECDGVVNICSGRPVSVRSLVESYIAERDATLELRRGAISLKSYEPFAFWGDARKFEGVCGS